MKWALAAFLFSACIPQAHDWGFEGVNDIPTPADDPARCGASLPDDPFATERAACRYVRGDSARTSLGISPEQAARIPIRHVIILMKENRSFDHLLGRIHRRGQPNADGAPDTFSNLDLNGNAVLMHNAGTTCINHDPGHQQAEMIEGINGGKMDGFVTSAAKSTGTDGHFAMTYNDEPELPFNYFLAKTYALNDRHFQSIASGTSANRTFLVAADALGVINTGILFPSPDHVTIMEILSAHKVSWAAYTDGLPFDGSLGWNKDAPGVHSQKEFLDALDNGTLPSVSFVDAVGEVTDDHPIADLQAGEVWLRDVYQHIVKSPQWPYLAVLLTYDEGGGFADHVPPPRACKSTLDSPFDTLGVRVPFIAISPWAKRNFVSHVVQDHTAILRFVEAIFNLPALSGRDANSPALFDLFDFSCGRDLSIPAAPAPGSGGCDAGR